MNSIETQHQLKRDMLVEKATKNVSDILSIAIERKAHERVLVVHDSEYDLTTIITEAYKNAVPDAQFIDFNSVTKDVVIAAFDALSPRDVVVLIQSTDFRLNEFRIRIHLFQKKLKVIDHLHLVRNTPDSWETYINAIAYDPDWYRGVGHRLKAVLENTSELRIESDQTTLLVTGGLEIPKVNIGDYTGMENIGGTFPIGEVFTEAKNLHTMHGSMLVYSFAGTDYNTTMYEPFRIDIADGIVTGWGDTAPNSFSDIVAQVKTNERAIIREIGFGLNRAITREHYLKDITAFERIHGLHVSLGEKHTVYKKQGITADKTRFHIDLFPVATNVYADDMLIFSDGKYLV